MLVPTNVTVEVHAEAGVGPGRGVRRRRRRHLGRAGRHGRACLGHASSASTCAPASARPRSSGRRPERCRRARPEGCDEAAPSRRVRAVHAGVFFVALAVGFLLRRSRRVGHERDVGRADLLIAFGLGGVLSAIGRATAPTRPEPGPSRDATPASTSSPDQRGSLAHVASVTRASHRCRVRRRRRSWEGKTMRGQGTRHTRVKAREGHRFGGCAQRWVSSVVQRCSRLSSRLSPEPRRSSRTAVATRSSRIPGQAESGVGAASAASDPGASLPFTGGDVAGVAAIGAATVAVGTIASRVRRHRQAV